MPHASPVAVLCCSVYVVQCLDIKCLPLLSTQPTTKTLLKTWGDLYSTFARLAAMVTNAEANVTCEELCSLICAKVTQEQLQVRMLGNVHLEVLLGIFPSVVSTILL